MNPNDLPQFSPSGQPEIYRLLKIGDYAIASDNAGFAVSKEAPKENESGAAKHKQDFVKPVSEKAEQIKSSALNAAKVLGNYAKPYQGFLVYPLVFAGSFIFFYTAINFPSLAAQAESLFTQKSQDQEILGEDLAAYNKWMQGYFYAVSQKDLLSANNDYDHDGLTNYDEYVMRTNPTIADSDGDGTTDGVELINGTNPWGAGNLTSAQSKLRDKINLNMVSERITYNISSNKGKSADDNSGNFDLSKPGVLSIPKLNLQAPLVWSKTPEDFERDLQNGVIHYPGTALPGTIGTMYVSGHSSDYVWKRDKYATIFTKINYLKPGDDVFVTVYGKDGKVYNYRYRVTEQKVYAPDDQTQFIDNSKAKLNLSTCWPIGTTKSRLVVSAELSGL